MSDLTITPRGVLHKGRFFHCKEMNTRIGQAVVLDDLGVADTPDLLVTFKDKTSALAACLHRASVNPASKGAFERALHRSGHAKSIPAQRGKKVTP